MNMLNNKIYKIEYHKNQILKFMKIKMIFNK